MLTKLEMEFAQIKYRWQMHDKLFEDNDTVDLLNRCGGKVFALLQSLLVYDTLAALCRLTDPKKSSGQENNSIYNQFEKQKVTLSVKEIQEIDSLLLSLEDKIKNIRNLRNKAISHNDLEVAKNVVQLPAVTYGEIDEVINLVCMALNKVFKTSGDYESVEEFGPGVNKLLRLLKVAEASENV